MSGPKHTPGPWRVAGLDRDDENEPYEVLVAAESDPSFLVSVYTSTNDRGTALKDEVTWANAKLIAGSPRLAEVLRSAPEPRDALSDDEDVELLRREYEKWHDAARAALREAGDDDA